MKKRLSIKGSATLAGYRWMKVNGLVVLLLAVASESWAAGEDRRIDSEVIELSAFVVYGGMIDTKDGMTGEDYHKSHPVVEQFREDFNKILLAYHKRLLVEELTSIRRTLEASMIMVKELNMISGTFGIREIDKRWDNYRSREKSVIRRLVEDPIFTIEALVVWDQFELERNGRRLPDNDFAHQIRYNTDLEKWERRVLTEWRVEFSKYNKRGGTHYKVIKEQGLNLDTNKGYHFINRGLPGSPPTDAYKDVKLTYPIFINTGKPVDEQVTYLREAYLKNLASIYDPFSWGQRRNTRFRGGFARDLLEQVMKAKYKVSEREWFDPVLAHLLNDVVTVQQFGSGEIYDFEMLKKVRVNQNILGTGLDLLNWKEGEDRSVSYNPNSQGNINLNFNNPGGARFILLDAYRRYPQTLIPVLRETIITLEEEISGKDLVRQILEEVTGMPAEVYIKMATEAQKAELEKYRYEM